MSEQKDIPEIVPWVREFFRCKPWIEDGLRALGISLYSLKDVFNEIADGRAFLWAGSKSCHVVQVYDTPGGRVVQAWIGAGDLEELLAMVPAIEEWARKEKGCKFAFVTGRRGWIRALRDSGYAEQHTTLSKELTQ